MSAADPKAVFLSYASQDAEAARRICETLRAEGVEVWFDADGGLEHGDEWDAKIRKQIKECVLFIPIISANTQARLEGYFRLEWELAAQRAMSIASGVPFILPVVVDDTREPEALVPDRFRMVQWTRLRPHGSGGQALEIPPDVLARFLKLWSHRIGAVKQTAEVARAFAPVDLGDTGSKARVTSSRPVPAAMSIGAILVVAIAALGVWQPWKKAAPGAGSSAGSAAKVLPAKSEPETAASLAAKAFEKYYPFCTPGRLQLADEFGRRATDLDPQLARAWGTRAGASARYLLRDWVSGEAARQRARDAQSFANRALTLDKNETEALLALGIVAWHQRAVGQAETLFRRVMTVDPANVQAPTLLSRVAREGGRAVEAVELMKGAVARAPRDPMVRLYAGFAYFDGWNFRKAAEQFEAAAHVEDFQGARAYKAWAEFFQFGDVSRMRAELDKLDLVYAEDDGKLALNLTCALYERRADRVVETAGRSASTYIDDWWTPKAWFMALAFESDQKENLARQQWQAAEAVVREKLKADPQDEILRVNLAITLAKLGRAKEVRADFDAVEAAWREQLNPIRALRLARFHASAGETSKSVEWLRQCVNRPTFLDENVTPRTLTLDPWWDGIRGSAEFRALHANPPAPPTPVEETEAGKVDAAQSPAPEKSVAVLAFKNVGGDPANEAIVEGIGLELISVLGRVSGLTVRGNSSLNYFKGSAATTQEKGRKLNATYLVDGSVQRMGDTVNIVANLTRASTDEVVWTTSPSLRREVKDIFAVQDEIARLIAENLSLKLGVRSASATAAINPLAFELYVQARQAWALRTRHNLEKAEELLQRALALQPDFARAHAGLADVWMTLAELDGLERYKNRTSPDWNRIVAKLDEASVLDPNSAESLATRAQMANLRWHFAEAERLFRRALELNPNYANAHQWYARHLTLQGRMDEALVRIEAALAADPFAPRIASNAAMIWVLAGRPTKGLQLAERSLALQSGNGQARIWKAKALVALNRVNDLVEFVRTWTDDEGASVRSLGPSFLAEVGRRDLIDGEFRPTRLETAGYVATSSYNFARANLILGRRSEALAALVPEEASYANCEWMAYLPLFDQIRSEPAFRQFYQALGLGDAHDRIQAWRAAHPPEIVEAKK